MRTLVTIISFGAVIALLCSCTPSNPSFRYDEKPFAQPDLDDAYMTPTSQ